MGSESQFSEYSFSPYGALSVTPSPVNRMMASFAVDFRDGMVGQFLGFVDAVVHVVFGNFFCFLSCLNLIPNIFPLSSHHLFCLFCFFI